MEMRKETCRGLQFVVNHPSDQARTHVIPIKKISIYESIAIATRPHTSLPAPQED